ncbi:hypothetical protein KBB06_04180 [Candidatus Gracilibacteria bacterium]|nr:hypothetical protein [Candidatus Gracilibacteria bacterium]
MKNQKLIRSGKSIIRAVAIGIAGLVILPVITVAFSQTLPEGMLNTPVGSPQVVQQSSATASTLGQPASSQPETSGQPVTRSSNLLASNQGIGTAHAAGATDAITPAVEKMYTDIGNLLTMFISVLQRILWPILILIGGLMKNDILFGGGMEERLLDIWVNIRNLVNILFVLVLLGIALYNVLGLKGQDWQFKAIMPKFVIALIAVNFSFIGLKVIIDAVNVVSTAIFAMPDVVQQNLSVQKDPNFDDKLCRLIYGDNAVNEKDKVKDASAVKANDLSTVCVKESGKLKLSPSASYMMKRFNTQNFALFMAINFQKTANLNQVVSQSDLKLKNLALNMIFSVIFTIIYGSAFVALFLVLLIRLIVLWLCLALSPLIALTYVFPQKMAASVGGEANLKEQFIQNAIAPIPIALVMTIGFILLDTLQNAKFSNPTLLASTTGFNFLSSGLSTMQDFIVAIASAAFIWKGVFMAMSKTAAKDMVKKVQDTVSGAGKFAMKAVEYAPIIPIYGPGEEGKGKPEMFGIGTTLEALRNIPTMMENKQLDQARKLSDILLGKSKYVSDAIKDSKSAQGAYGLALGSSFGHEDKQLQRELGRWMEKNPTLADLAKYFPREGIRDGDNNYKTPKEWREALQKGNVGTEGWNRWMSHLRDSGISPESYVAPTLSADNKKIVQNKESQIEPSVKAAVSNPGGSKQAGDDLAKAINELATAIKDPKQRQMAINELLQNVRDSGGSEGGNIIANAKAKVATGANKSLATESGIEWGTLEAGANKPAQGGTTKPPPPSPSPTGPPDHQLQIR